MDNEKSKLGCYGIILTCNKYHENMSVDEAKKSIKRLLSALRIRANREKWSYSIFIGFSVSNQKIKKERPHFHILLTADPGVVSKTTSFLLFKSIKNLDFMGSCK